MTFHDARNEFERSFITTLLEQTGGNITAASRLAGLNRTSLYALLKKHRIARPLISKEDKRRARLKAEIAKVSARLESLRAKEGQP